jgi:hypothetical protein
MTKEEFDNLSTGSLIQHKGTGNAYIIADVIHKHGDIDFFIAVRTIKVSNPMEWKLVEGWQK